MGDHNKKINMYKFENTLNIRKKVEQIYEEYRKDISNNLEVLYIFKTLHRTLVKVLVSQYIK